MNDDELIRVLQEIQTKAYLLQYEITNRNRFDADSAIDYDKIIDHKKVELIHSVERYLNNVELLCPHCTGKRIEEHYSPFIKNGRQPLVSTCWGCGGKGTIKLK